MFGFHGTDKKDMEHAAFVVLRIFCYTLSSCVIDVSEHKIMDLTDNLSALMRFLLSTLSHRTAMLIKLYDTRRMAALSFSFPKIP